ncbi:MAG TPA: DUF190 domain-containing protein [Blastocatellia bacterium]
MQREPDPNRRLCSFWHRLPRLSEDLPVTINMIDTEEKIRRALPALRK